MKIIWGEKLAHSTDVVITGFDILSPIGLGQGDFWESLRQGASGIAEVTEAFDQAQRFSSPIKAALIKQFQSKIYLPDVSVRRMAGITQFALAVSRLALQDAQISDPNEGVSKGVGIIFCTTHGAINFSTEFHKGMTIDGLLMGRPIYFSNSLFNTPLGEICKYLQIHQVSNTIISGTTGGIEALSLAMDMIKSELLDRVIVVGSEEFDQVVDLAYSQLDMLAYQKEHLHRPNRSPDFKGERFICGEGAVALVVESINTANQKKAKIYGQLLAADYCHAPLPQSIIQRTLQKAGITVKDIDYISAGLNSLQTNSKELQILKEIFGTRANKPIISSLKPLLGECFATGSMMQVIVPLLIFKTGSLPLTINWQGEEQAVADLFEGQDIRTALIHSLNYDGTSAAVVLRRI